jgi:hypothetical protein
MLNAECAMLNQCLTPNARCSMSMSNVQMSNAWLSIEYCALTID